MAEHKHGSMDITTQEHTFAGFITWTIRGAIAVIIVLLILAIIG